MPIDIVGRERFLVPGDVEWLVESCASYRGVDGKSLVGVDHDLEIVADRSADGFEPPDVLVRGAADLDLGAPETRSLGPLGILNQG
jgi:hypothetical protein